MLRLLNGLQFEYSAVCICSDDARCFSFIFISTLFYELVTLLGETVYS